LLGFGDGPLTVGGEGQGGQDGDGERSVDHAVSRAPEGVDVLANTPALRGRAERYTEKTGSDA
jgi:hypothetical protein